MAFPLQYHGVVSGSHQRWIPAQSALFGALLLLPFSANNSFAQINTNSPGSGHSISVAPPAGAIVPPTRSIAPPTGSVTPPSGVPFRSGFVPSNSGISRNSFPHFPGGIHDNNGHHRRHHSADGTAYYPYFYGVPVPYADDMSSADTDASNDDDDPEYQGGPTVFDRRGSGAASYVPPSYEGPAHAQDGQSGVSAAAQPAGPTVADIQQPPTTLVFKDGHQIEVENYAIVGQTLYDLTPGHPRKIALSDLDLPATEKHNDDRGVSFQLPPSAQGT